jgi:amino acid transporter
MPLSGGEYNWVAILAPEKMSNFLSYTVGWVTVIAWQAACASVTFINTMLIIAIASVTHPTYQMTMWQAMLVFWALVALSVFVNTYLGRAFPSIEALVLILHIVGFFVILIVLIYLAPKNPTEMVFNNFFNGGGFSSTAQSVIIGSVTIMYSFNGVDGATHMGTLCYPPCRL